MAKLSEDLRSCLRLFAFYLGNGTLDLELLDFDYRPALVKYGSTLEMVFAIYTNHLEIDEDGRVTEGLAYDRVAEYIRSVSDPSYVVDPPFEPWETRLVGPFGPDEDLPDPS
ncbi:DUF7677 family protein [Actinomadura oligospora]|uniref:DUF7677 family protein n=1 Tax=Actinomadura oligospora TaxID=111804 RepID=UPI000479F527|nr:hypothetical protein [Actinomadura oligospora]